MEWKVTEFRHFLLYSGIVALKQNIPEDVYDHFLLLFVALYNFSSPLPYERFLDYAINLLIGYVQHLANYYVNNMVVYHVHSLMALVDDVKPHRPMDQFSAFSFESFLAQLKISVRKKHQTLP